MLVTAEGWTVVDRSPVLFRRTTLTGELSIPVRGARLDLLRALLNVSDETWPLLRGWLVAALFPSIPHPILLLGGVQGTGKTTALRLLCGLVDPSPAPVRSEPHDSEQWALMAAGSWCIPLDNVSTISPWISDALCKAVTGDGFVRRKSGTDGDLTILEFRRVIAMSSIDPGLLRGDLADRLLLVELDRIDEHRRQPESHLVANFRRLKPLLFGALLDELSTVLRRLPEVRLRQLPRMADFARILAALDLADASGVPCATGVPSHLLPSPLTPHPSPLHADGADGADGSAGTSDAVPGGALAIYLGQNIRLAAEVIDGDPVALAISKLMEAQAAWEGTAEELLAEIGRRDQGRDRPQTPRALSGRLRRLAPALATVGINIDYRRETDRFRTRRIRISSTLAE